MNAGEIGGWVGGIAGGLIGLAGGLIGTACSIRNTNGPRERAFVVRCAIVAWIAILVFLGLLFLLPGQYRWLLWLPYAILLPLGIISGNKRQAQIRREEAPDQSDPPDRAV